MSTLLTEYHLIDVTLTKENKNAEICQIAVAGYLREFKGSKQVPTDIVWLISHFYSTGFMDANAVKCNIQKDICSTATLKNNPLPVIRPTKNVRLPKFCSNIICIVFIAISIILLYWLNTIEQDHSVLMITVILSLSMLICCCYFTACCHRIFQYMHIVLKPIKTQQQRILTLNTLFDIEPVIKLKIDGTKIYISERTLSVSKKKTFEKEQILVSDVVETMFDPNILNDEKIYNQWCYCFDYDLLIRFDGEQERIKYEQICKHFINNNITDDLQVCSIKVEYELNGKKYTISKEENGDFDNCFIIVDATHPLFRRFLTFILVFLHRFIKKKKFVITKYITIGGLKGSHWCYSRGVI
eukprot:195594_1